MRTYWSIAHREHRPGYEIIDGQPAPHVEVPDRAERVLAAVGERALGPLVELADALGSDSALDDADRQAILRVHDDRYVAFLEGFATATAAAGRSGEQLPYVFPGGGLGPRPDAEPEPLDARLGYWALDAGTPLAPGTWSAVLASARVALAAARDVAGGARGAFALCRPPGHHATRSAFGGYCYLNNSAIAAESFLTAGASRVAVLDVDYHHGNGTQSIFWERADVLTLSLHADPRQEYPYFTGFADEAGAGPGAGRNRNLPLPWGTGWAEWSAALDTAAAEVRAFAPDAVVVPLGVDTHENDPISRFRLTTEDYLEVGRRIAGLGRPTLFVLEGGYATNVIGINVANVLSGFWNGGDASRP